MQFEEAILINPSLLETEQNKEAKLTEIIKCIHQSAREINDELEDAFKIYLDTLDVMTKSLTKNK